MRDENPVGQVGEFVFFRQTAGSARAALISNVDQPGGLVDVVVYCSGNSLETRERWACGHSVVTFRGGICHVSQAESLGAANWWSRAREDCPGVKEASRAP